MGILPCFHKKKGTLNVVRFFCLIENNRKEGREANIIEVNCEIRSTDLLRTK